MCIIIFPCHKEHFRTKIEISPIFKSIETSFNRDKMIHWITTNNFRSKDNSALHPSQTTYQALLSSTIADGDVVTDWLYYFNIFCSDDDIPKWLLILHLTSCIFGTISWLSVATDGRGVYWVKAICLWTILIPMLIACLPYFFLPISLSSHVWVKRATFIDVSMI